jgi:hypothetical protein
MGQIYDKSYGGCSIGRVESDGQIYKGGASLLLLLIRK